MEYLCNEQKIQFIMIRKTVYQTCFIDSISPLINSKCSDQCAIFFIDKFVFILKNPVYKMPGNFASHTFHKQMIKHIKIIFFIIFNLLFSCNSQM